MIDFHDEDGPKAPKTDPLRPLNVQDRPQRPVAAALKQPEAQKGVPLVAAAGRGALAERIIALALENGVKIREDGPLAEMLVSLEIDSPIPSEAFMAVAEILHYIYKANGAPNPFDAVFQKGEDGGPSTQDGVNNPP